MLKTLAWSGGDEPPPRWKLELHRRRLFVGHARVAEVEELPLGEAERAREQRRGKTLDAALYSCTALLKKRRAAAILFSRSESSACNCWKFALALRSG